MNVCAVEGNFDDAQSAVKRIFGDKELAANVSPPTRTSCSPPRTPSTWAVCVPQVVYYFSAYAQLLENQVINVGDEVEFVVPTGNFGDILAGYYAKMLGLPVKHLVVASDKNNVLFDFLTTGTYNRQRPFFQTISPSMDILISSNLERMLYYMSEGDTRLISMLMNDLSQWGTYEVPEPLLAKIRQLFGCGWADEDQVREMIADCWKKNRYVIDPHTACALLRGSANAARPVDPARDPVDCEPLQVPARGQRGTGPGCRPAPISNAWMCCLARPAPPLRPPCVDLRPPMYVSRTSCPSTAWRITSKRPPRRCKQLCCFSTAQPASRGIKGLTALWRGRSGWPERRRCSRRPRTARRQSERHATIRS